MALKEILEPHITREEMLNIIGALETLLPEKFSVLYIKSLFTYIPGYTFAEFEEGLLEFEDDEEIQRRYRKVLETLESRLVERALRGGKDSIPPSTAQFILQNAFGFGKDTSKGYNVTIVYESIEEDDEDDG